MVKLKVNQKMDRGKNQFEYIAIEGVIGAGKTSLAKKLSERHNARLLLEEFEDNPFLPKFYDNPERYAFQTQLSFLASRFQQQEALKSQDLFSDFTISDYMFEKDRIFARINLAEDELALYDRIFNIMNQKAAKPDLVVYLQTSIERLMANIRLRDRDYESNLKQDYLKKLLKAYNNFFYYYDKSPIIIINATDIDFVQNSDHLKTIEEQIFYRPVRSRTMLQILSSE